MGNDVFFAPFQEQDLFPLEERLEIVKNRKKLSIGIPKETCWQERRVGLTPDAVQVLVESGVEVVIERGAGKGSFFTDIQYAEAGAKVVDDPLEAFGQLLVLKINPPTLEEIAWLKPHAFLISALQIGLCEAQYFEALSQKKINAMAFEFMVDEYRQLPLVRLIGEIAGTASVLYAAELLALSNGNMLGGIIGVRPTEVVVIGSGMVGESAVRSALGLGASVRVFDNSLSKLRRLYSAIGGRVSTSVIDPKELRKALRRADVVIGALHSVMPIVPEEMVMKMKAGSVVIDVGIDFGRVFETSRVTTLENPYFVTHGVVHSALPNLTSRVPRVTSKAISNFFLSYLLRCEEEGGMENLLMKREEAKQSLYMYRGKHTKKILCDRFGLPFHDINLLLF